MNALTRSIIDHGMDGILVDTECQVTKGLPAMIIVGFAGKAVGESKERIRSAFGNSGLTFPRKRIVINLAPGDIPKDGTSLDVAIAVSILIATEQVTAMDQPSIFIGELGLDGSIRPCRGVIGKLLEARRRGITQCFIPSSNLTQARAVKGLQLYPVHNLSELYLHLSGAQKIASSGYRPITVTTPENDTDMSDITGQTLAKRALLIAAAGGHNILLSGPPGTGKSMLAKAFRGILPAMSQDEMLQTTHLHSLVSDKYESIITHRPFRSPHHTASDTSIVGGGQFPRPGEISLSHNGVLFMDELPEFSRVAIEALRQPLEDRVITIARAKGSVAFPAHFILVGTANPCPCGYYATEQDCICSPAQISRYQQKLSGPIMDRIDMYVEVHEVHHAQLLKQSTTVRTSTQLSADVQQARALQSARHGKPLINGDLSNRQLKAWARLTPEAATLLNTASQKLAVSARSYMRIVKVARTIADLESAEDIEATHVAEALQYRRKSTAITPSAVAPTWVN